MKSQGWFEEPVRSLQIWANASLELFRGADGNNNETADGENTYVEEFEDEVPLGGRVELVDQLQKTVVAKTSHDGQFGADCTLLIVAQLLLVYHLQRKLATAFHPTPTNSSEVVWLGKRPQSRKSATPIKYPQC